MILDGYYTSFKINWDQNIGIRPSSFHAYPGNGWRFDTGCTFLGDGIPSVRFDFETTYSPASNFYYTYGVDLIQNRSCVLGSEL